MSVKQELNFFFRPTVIRTKYYQTLPAITAPREGVVPPWDKNPEGRNSRQFFSQKPPAAPTESERQPERQPVPEEHPVAKWSIAAPKGYSKVSLPWRTCLGFIQELTGTWEGRRGKS